MPLSQNAARSKDRRHSGQAPLMQHRHYAWIAGQLRNSRPDGYDPDEHYMQRSAGEAFWVDVCGGFADKLAETNPNFDRDRFMRACGV